MKIVINDHRKIFAVQKEFSEMFPYLKIEFLAKPKKSGAAASSKVIKLAAKTIGDSRTEHTKGTLTISPSMTVAELESSFRDIFGITAVVLRKSGKIWLKATVTDKWTLEDQNKQGEELSKQA